MTADEDLAKTCFFVDGDENLNQKIIELTA